MIFNIVLTAEEGAPARQTSEKLNTAEMILKSLNPEEIKEIVAKITEETLQNIKVYYYYYIYIISFRLSECHLILSNSQVSGALAGEGRGSVAPTVPKIVL